ncbi:hypothetical protein tinsulaeT_35910 [Thalassotalea insulae]|uniref:Peptidase M12B domain-containing protein n=1 Tax=Thalassotalea insulae TaxID=2056778 RepID=A0ABQ6H047_9GAMM|nr:leucine-rich repeat domain-containing protein [Thalassotalea insulae]GLX80251.1 hypothetical protein tinsulaeT_35910 [Thalassotalea insulae]
MKSTKLLILLLIVLCTGFQSISHASNNKLWNITSKQNIKHNSVKKLGMGLSKQYVSVHSKLISELQVGTTITIPIRVDEYYSASINRININPDGSKSIVARIENDSEALPQIITTDGNSVFARIVTPNGSYSLSHLGSDDLGLLINENELDKRIDSTKSDFILNNKSTFQQFNTQPQGKANNSRTINKKLFSKIKTQFNSVSKQDNDAVATVDVMVLYTPNASELYQSNVSTRINHLFAVTNQIFEDSGVKIQVNPVLIQEYTYSESKPSKDLIEDIGPYGNSGNFWLASDNHYEISNLRFKVKADLVVMMRPYVGDGICGIAYVSGNGHGDMSGSWISAYSHVSIDCSDYVLAHELGHNMGLMHSRRQVEEDTENIETLGVSFDFALGFGVDNEFTTVMAYEDVFSANKIYKFSSPNLDCNGYSCGIDKDNEQGADAVYALNAVRQSVASFLDTDEGLTPIEDAKHNVDNSNLIKCIERVQGSNLYAEQVYSLFCADYESISSLSGIEGFPKLTKLSVFPSTISSLTPIENLTGLYRFDISSSLLSDLSSLSTLTQLGHLSVSAPNISDYSFLKNLNNLRSLSLSESNFENINNIANAKYMTRLEIESEFLSDLLPLEQLVGVQYLYLGNGQIEDISALSALENLQSLSLINNKINDISALSNLTNLKYLQLFGNEIETVSSLSNLTGLETLDLGSNLIESIEGLENLTELPDLNLSDNKLKNLEPLSSMSGLKYLHLKGNEIVNGQPISLLNNLESFSIDNNLISSISFLASPEKLVYLTANNNEINDISPLTDAVNLQFLELNNNHISDLYPLNDKLKITNLRLSGNGITDSQGIYPLLEGLSVLHIRNNEIPCSQVNYINENINENAYVSIDELTCEDFDQDGIPDIEDTDDDNDGIEDSEDSFPLDASESVDTDNDGIGNNADTDDDNDGIEDSEDSFPLDASESVDTDNDGIGNNADTDDDSDGVEDSEDAFPLDASESVDTDNDGIGNNADTDDDNDGVEDSADAYPLDPSRSSNLNNANNSSSSSTSSGGGSMYSLLLLLLLHTSLRPKLKSMR